MAMQTGVGLSKILILAGAGYTGTILLKNGKFSDLLGELQVLVKRIERSRDRSDGNSDDSDALATQMHRLAMEVRQLASSRQITVMNGTPGAELTPFVIPAATLGVLGYGYMWLKGISFSDLMYMTKRNMANAVSNVTKHLENVSEALSSAKRHLMQRLQNVDDKIDKQKELSKAIQETVALAHADLTNIEGDFEALHHILGCVDGKLDSLEYKQEITNIGLVYLCNLVGGKETKMPEGMNEDKLRLSGKYSTRNFLATTETPWLKGLKEIADT